MLKQYFTSIFLFLFVSLSAMAQSAGDYRVKQNGDWDDPATWEYYNGTTWVNATDFPGTINGSNQIVIDDGISVFFNANDVVDFNQDGLVISFGELVFLNNNNVVLNIPFIRLMAKDESAGEIGVMRWDGNADVYLPEGAIVSINGGDLITSSNSCSDSARLIIGSDIISTCNGNSGSSGSFDDFVNGGGTRVTIITNRNKTYRVNKN